MATKGREFVPLLPQKDVRPLSSSLGGSAGGLSIIRDQFSISTWLCLGALAQGSLFLTAGSRRLALLPALLILLYRALDAYAMVTGWKRNTYTDGVIHKKFSAQFPDETGRYGAKPADADVVVLMIGTRSNHPLGILAPHFKQLGDYFGRMNRELETRADEYGFLGSTAWLNASERAAQNQLMNVMYFRSVEGLHAFAHGDLHRKGWDWWVQNLEKNAHISLFHETYHVPKGHWESIYLNSHAGGVTSTTHKVFDNASGTDMWASPVVDASKGLLRTSAGRMSRSKEADEHDKYGYDYTKM